MIRKLLGATAAAALLVGGSVAVASPAGAAPLVPVAGNTALVLNIPTVEALIANNVSAYSIQPSGSTLLVEGKPGAWVIDFPMDRFEKGKRITHIGGLLLSHTCGVDPQLGILNPTINLVKAKVSAELTLNGEALGRKNVFGLSGGQAVETGLENVKVKLLPGVADLMNESLCTHTFVEGQRVGKGYVTFYL